MMANLWEFFFKYPPLIFERGRLIWATPVPAWVLLAAAAVLALLAAWSYRRARGQVERRDRVVLVTLRLGVIGLIVLCLFRPTLLVSTAVPQENFLGILIDDSRSMRIADREGEVRGDLVRSAFGSNDSELLGELEKRFRLRFFRFAGDVSRIDKLDGLSFAGDRSHLGAALTRAQEELSAVPLSGLVLVSDGADNSEAALSESLLSLRAANIPVFTVGVGEEAFERDVEVSRVAAPASVLRGSSLFVDVVIAQTGYGGRTVELMVEDGGRVVDVQQVELPRDGATATVRVDFTARDPGARRYRFRVSPQQGERVLENNQREVLVEVRDGREKILYFEGEPRFEVKFLRRAVADDPQLQLVVLQRTAENRFLRLDVDSATELESGFPRSREELFSYRALVLGSVEASYFTNDQLRMISEFVGDRGGGLLMLGGRRSFAEGGYAGTPLADVLPVVLDEGAARDTTFFAEVKVTPTRAGAAHAVLQVADDAERSASRWADLPPLSTFNRVGGLKPGATALLTGSGPRLPGGQVILAHHRYGRGQALAFVAQDSWMWQMHAEVPLDDMTHERFWRQMLRWLVSDVPGPLRVSVGAASPAPGDAVPLTVEVRDDRYLAVNDAEVVARVTSPTGETEELPLEWTVARDGEYRASFAPREAGVHELSVEARRAGRLIATDTLYVTAAAGDDEFFAAQLRSPLLKRIAEETGGRFYTQADLSSLPEDVSHSGRGISVVEERELWDMPIIFFLLVGLVAAEWGYRRARGLP